MTADYIQNKIAAKGIKRAPVLTSRPKAILPKNSSSKPLELTRNQDFLSGHHDIFDVLAHHSREKETWSSDMNDTLSTLERTRALLGAAQQTIQDQSEKLRYLEDISGLCPLTGLLNRVGFTRVMVKEIARTNRGLNDGGLVVIFSLENLSRIESQHGTKAAETAVRLIARALETEIRDMDHAARVQDDEFVLLFVQTTMEQALSRLQNMALRLNKLSMIWESEEIHLSLSLGLKSYGPGARPEQIFKYASDDLARNRIGTSQAPIA